MKKIFKYFTLLMIGSLISPISSFAQGNFSFSMRVSPIFSNSNFGDLQKLNPLSGAKTTTVLFEMVIRNQESSDGIINANSIRFIVYYNDVPLPIAIVNSKSFTLKGNEELTISNVNMMSLDSRIGFKIEGNYSIDQLVKIIYGPNKTMSDIHPGLPLPGGDYKFALFYNGSEESVVSLFISRSSGFVQILSPGNQVGDGLDEIFTKNPVITITGDAAKYEVSVVKADGNNLNAVEYKNRTPVFKTETNSTVVPYPTVGVTPLDPGSTYFVFVSGYNEGLSGKIAIEAAPHYFKVSPTLGGGGSSGGGSQVSSAFQVAFGATDGAIMNILENGTLQRATLNNTPISANQLMDVFAKIRNGLSTESVKIKSIKVE